MLNKLRILLYIPQLIFPALAFSVVRKEDKIEKDIFGWKKQFKIAGTNNFRAFLYLMVNFKDFRNLFYFRLKCIAKHKQETAIKRSLVICFMFLSEITLKKYSTLLISGEIGGGLVLIHAYYSILSPKKLGENCKIWHEVTIGFRDNIAPIIGDNVQISPGAKIIGDIQIGNNSKIGPNALVIESIPENSVVISAKGTILKTAN